MPAPKYTNHLDLDGHQLKNFIIEKVDALPAASAANAGRALYLNPRNRVFFSTGTSWEEIGTASPSFTARVASTANVDIATLAPAATIDGVVLAQGDRVLLKDQAAPAQNGIYVIGAAAPATRAADADTTAEFPRGSTVAITAGTANTGKTYRNDAAANYVVGADPMPFVEVAAGTAYTGGAGIDVTGTVISRKRFTGAIPAPGAGTSVTITHNLNMDRPPVEVWIVADNSRAEGVYVQNVDANNVLLDFAVAPVNGQYEVVIG